MGLYFTLPHSIINTGLSPKDNKNKNPSLMNRYTVHIDMACVPDCLMMIQMYAVNRPKPRNYGRDEGKPIHKNRMGLALIGWDHPKAFSGDDTKKGNKTVVKSTLSMSPKIHKIWEGLVSITMMQRRATQLWMSDADILIKYQ
ncbi:hypothetical protein K439DRAFT_1613243 [Ramaria rubella]|nr:hypothetical protein K439DRAFT_1613243 [Ramaria rubella]